MHMPAVCFGLLCTCISRNARPGISDQICFINLCSIHVSATWKKRINRTIECWTAFVCISDLYICIVCVLLLQNYKSTGSINNIIIIEGATQYITLVIIIVILVIVVGDGAGVGKGRTIAGIIYQNYLEGRKKALW